MDSKLGHYAFLIGIILAIIGGLFQDVIEPNLLISLLVVLGFVVGLLNITTKETSNFLIATIALMIAGGANFDILTYGIGPIIVAILEKVVIFVAPAAIIVALKQIYMLAQD